ncbi:hypothetical protein BDEG_25378 [Batrachochytrium dendrobatidis JEL423]|nr:hypothetical protein BDEG_25378 [Batrachochytrium dendrobatidis JEL423]
MSWYEIDRVEMDLATNKAQVFGTKFINGVGADKIAPIGIAFTENWRFHYFSEEIKTIEKKLGIEKV